MIRIAIILIERSDKKLFLHRRRTDKRVFPGLLAVGAGGRIELDETPIEGAIRELWEETGLRTLVTPVADFIFTGSGQPYEVHLFHTFAEEVPKPCTEEWSEWSWVSRAQLRGQWAELCPDTVAALARWPDLTLS